jgi:uncharacterized protein
LHWAAFGGNDSEVKLLLSSNANVNAVDRKGKTPLTLAIQHDHKTTAEILRQHGGHE